MDKEQIIKKAKEIGKEIDNTVEEKSTKHGFTKFQIWLFGAIGIAFVVMAVKLLLK